MTLAPTGQLLPAVEREVEWRIRSFLDGKLPGLRVLVIGEYGSPRHSQLVGNELTPSCYLSVRDATIIRNKDSHQLKLVFGHAR